ncbi:hypothetical protein A2U01_0117792, partial [Trifolium medium]|nr:hypothetical protein [Trifolium medium]
ISRYVHKEFLYKLLIAFSKPQNSSLQSSLLNQLQDISILFSLFAQLSLKCQSSMEHKVPSVCKSQ